MAPATQRIVVYHKPGGASVLQVEDGPIPKRGDGEVLIKQFSSSVNPVDFKMRSTNKESLPKVRRPTQIVIALNHGRLCSQRHRARTRLLVTMRRSREVTFQASSRRSAPAARSVLSSLETSIVQPLACICQGAYAIARRAVQERRQGNRLGAVVLDELQGGYVRRVRECQGGVACNCSQICSTA